MNAGAGRETASVGVDVWLWELDVAADARAALLALLSPEEQARATRFFKPLDRDRWIVSRGRTRQLLGGALGLAPEAVSFVSDPHGRPYLAGIANAPSFNISHSAGLGALAISFGAQVGVDVEAVRDISPDEIAWALSPAERAQLEVLGGGLTDFFRFWTAKEALMKGLGLGAALPLHDFDIMLANEGPRLSRLAIRPAEAQSWSFREALAAPGIRGALAARTDGRALEVSWRSADNLG